MEDFLSAFQLRTALPFGYLAFFIIWVAITFWTFKNIVSLYLKKKFGSKFIFNLIVLTFCGFFLLSNIVFSNNVDLNPIFTQENVIGTWHDGDSQLTLESEGTAVIALNKEDQRRIGLRNGEALWDKYQDFEIIIKYEDSSKTALLRVLKYGDNFRIIFKDWRDPDMWDGDLGFKRN